MFASPRSGFAAPATQTFDFVESFFDTLAKKLRQLSTISMARRVKGDAARITNRMASRFSCGGQAAYDRDLRSLSVFKTRVLF